VQAGDCLRTVDGAEKMVSVSVVEGQGVYSLVTKEEFVVVNGVPTPSTTSTACCTVGPGRVGVWVAEEGQRVVWSSGALANAVVQPSCCMLFAVPATAVLSIAVPLLGLLHRLDDNRCRVLLRCLPFPFAANA